VKGREEKGGDVRFVTCLYMELGDLSGKDHQDDEWLWLAGFVKEYPVWNFGPVNNFLIILSIQVLKITFL